MDEGRDGYYDDTGMFFTARLEKPIAAQVELDPELLKTPEMRAELARRLAKTPVHLDALVAQAIRDAVKQERADIDAFLADRLKECLCDDDRSPCNACMEIARIRGVLDARPER